MTHKEENLAAIIVCLNSNAPGSAIAEAIWMNLEISAIGKFANLHELKFEVDGSGHAIVWSGVISIVVAVCALPWDIVITSLRPLAI